jgi:hypothetical protein
MVLRHDKLTSGIKEEFKRQLIVSRKAIYVLTQKRLFLSEDCRAGKIMHMALATFKRSLSTSSGLFYLLHLALWIVSGIKCGKLILLSVLDGMALRAATVLN